MHIHDENGHSREWMGRPASHGPDDSVLLCQHLRHQAPGGFKLQAIREAPLPPHTAGEQVLVFMEGGWQATWGGGLSRGDFSGYRLRGENIGRVKKIGLSEEKIRWKSSWFVSQNDAPLKKNWKTAGETPGKMVEHFLLPNFDNKLWTPPNLPHSCTPHKQLMSPPLLCLRCCDFFKPNFVNFEYTCQGEARKLENILQAKDCPVHFLERRKKTCV